jgi:hypothetical protein
MWFNLSAARSEPGDAHDIAVRARDMVAAKMTTAQIAEAQKLAREWKPKWAANAKLLEAGALRASGKVSDFDRGGVEMRFVWMVGAVIVSMLGVAQAASDFVGGGAAPCSLFVKMNKGNPEMTGLVYQSWLQGYFTGVNTVLGSQGKPRFDLSALKDISHNEFMGTYCAEHPNADYKDGALELMGRLPRVP